MVNFILAGKVEITNLEKDFVDGRGLILLVELLFSRKPNFKSGIDNIGTVLTRTQSFRNLNWAVDTLSAVGVAASDISVSGIFRLDCC